ncbi:MAG: transposase-like protein [Chlamydiales bacterium]|jgi:transposase-like protein
MFDPPRCPFRGCPNHSCPGRGFFVRHGYYKPQCRPWRIPRFRCKSCRRTFSRQTFRADYHDHRPDLNAHLFRLLASGVGLRQSSRMLRLTPRCTELKFRKIARHLRRFNLNVRGRLLDCARIQFDELETYEGRRNTRPLSVPLLVDRDSRFIIWGESAPIRPRGKMTQRRKEAIHDEERRFGRRKDLSARSVLRTLRRGFAMTVAGQRLLFETDEKTSYPRHLRATRGRCLISHQRTNSKLARMTWNPLFPINHTEAMLRDTTGRLRRESWLVSKKRRYLDIGLHIFMAFRNYVRPRFNGEKQSPAQMMGFVSRLLSVGEVLSWRQDWGRGSIHPLSRHGRDTVESRMTRIA